MIPAMISHPDKVLFPDDGITKGELCAYYQSIAPLMLPHIARRPLTMERFPAGIGKKGFIQKDVSKGFPDWLERVEIERRTDEGGVVHYPLGNDERALVWLANQNSITPHVWASRVPRLDRPDLCVFDLDPSQDQPASLRAAALAVSACRVGSRPRARRGFTSSFRSTARPTSSSPGGSRTAPARCWSNATPRC